MVAVATHTLTTEKCREAKVLRHLVFRDDLVTALWFADNEFADLWCQLAKAISENLPR